MTTAADEAAAALRASAAINAGQQEMVDESRRLLAGLLREEMRLAREEIGIAVSEGIQAVLTSEEFWAKVFAVLQRQASERTGRFVLGGLTVVVKKALWIGAFALLAYSIGGWTLLKAVWAALTKG